MVSLATGRTDPHSFMTTSHRSHSRRRFLHRLAAGAALTVADVPALLAMARLPEVQGIHELAGQVSVNGVAAAKGTRVAPGDSVATASGSHAVFVVGRSAFLLRENAHVELAPAEKADSLVVHALRILSGALLSVHPRGERTIATHTGIIGIRGTGLYVDATPDLTYACVCYGTADLATPGGEVLETVGTRHHDSPRYIHAPGATRLIEPAPVIDHTDAELIMLESLVGRVPPFVDDPGSGGY
jgi:hypothetical protein